MKAVLHTIGAQTVEPPSLKQETGGAILDQDIDVQASGPRQGLTRIGTGTRPADVSTPDRAAAAASLQLRERP